MNMTPSRKFAVTSMVAASVAVGLLVANLAGSAAPAGVASTVTVSSQTLPSGEILPTVTVVAKRLNAAEKVQATLLRAKDIARNSIAGTGNAIAAANRG
jgi:hypothetical protein